MSGLAPGGVPATSLGPSTLATLLWLLTTAGVALPLGVLAGMWLDELAPHGRARKLLGSGAATLARLPSVATACAVAGACLLLGVRPDGWLTGSLVGAISLLPLSAQATRRTLHAISPRVREVCAALGASRAATVTTVVLPTARPLMTAELLRATARVAGDAAPLIVLSALTTGLSADAAGTGARAESAGLVSDTLGPTVMRALLAGQLEVALSGSATLLALVLLLRGVASIIHGRAADRLVDRVDPR